MQIALWSRENCVTQVRRRVTGPLGLTAIQSFLDGYCHYYQCVMTGCATAWRVIVFLPSSFAGKKRIAELGLTMEYPEGYEEKMEEETKKRKGSAG